MPRESKYEERARKIGALEVKPALSQPWIALIWFGRDCGHLGMYGRTRAEAIRNVVRAADRLAQRVERSRG